MRNKPGILGEYPCYSVNGGLAIPQLTDTGVAVRVVAVCEDCKWYIGRKARRLATIGCTFPVFGTSAGLADSWLLPFSLDASALSKIIAGGNAEHDREPISNV
jgi:hypothetical protein